MAVVVARRVVHTVAAVTPIDSVEQRTVHVGASVGSRLGVVLYHLGRRRRLEAISPELLRDDRLGFTPVQDEVTTPLGAALHLNVGARVGQRLHLATACGTHDAHAVLELLVLLAAAEHATEQVRAAMVLGLAVLLVDLLRSLGDLNAVQPELVGRHSLELAGVVAAAAVPVAGFELDLGFRIHDRCHGSAAVLATTNLLAVGLVTVHFLPRFSRDRTVTQEGYHTFPEYVKTFAGFRSAA